MNFMSLFQWFYFVGMLLNLLLSCLFALYILAKTWPETDCSDWAVIGLCIISLAYGLWPMFESYKAFMVGSFCSK
jgi:hypothetical protein